MSLLSFRIKLAGACILGLAFSISSCSKSPDMITSSAPKTAKLKSAQVTADYVCNPQSSPLVSKQKVSGGTINICVIPGSGNIAVSVTVNDGWSLKKVQMFAGNKEDVPLAGNDYPAYEDFPVNVSFPTTETSYSYEFRTTPTFGNQVIVVHADLKQANRNRYSGPSEEFWIEGTPFGEKKWAMYYNYMLMPCSPVAP